MEPQPHVGDRNINRSQFVETAANQVFDPLRSRDICRNGDSARPQCANLLSDPFEPRPNRTTIDHQVGASPGKAMLRDSERAGHAVNADHVVPGVHAFAVAIHAPQGDVVGSLSIAGPAEVLPIGKASNFLKILKEEARAIEAELIQKRSALNAHNVTTG
jgi:hypothetical protein